MRIFKETSLTELTRDELITECHESQLKAVVLGVLAVAIVVGFLLLTLAIENQHQDDLKTMVPAPCAAAK